MQTCAALFNRPIAARGWSAFDYCAHLQLILVVWADVALNLVPRPLIASKEGARALQHVERRQGCHFLAAFIGGEQSGVDCR